MFNKKDYLDSLNKARKKRNRNPYMIYFLIGGGVLLAILLAVGIGFLVRRQINLRGASGEPGQTRTETLPESDAASRAEDASLAEEESRKEEESKAEQEAAQKQAVVDSYENLGLVQVSDSLYVRETPDSSSSKNIIGRMQANAACEILGQEGDWYHIVSGDVEGYIASQYVITGQEAREKALEEVKLRAVVTIEEGGTLNIRSTPEIVEDNSNIVAYAMNGDKYEVVSQSDGWIEIPSGYISSDYAEVEYALNEARRLDQKAVAVNQYDNLLVSKVKSYLNVRSSPEDQGNRNIIGKMPGNAAGEILETLDGWYKIKSGNIEGYVSAEYTATGQEAVDLGINAATKMAIVNVDGLRVRKEPNTESGIWTQISKEDRYEVIQELDGWVQIDLDTGDSESGESDAAYISTRDNNVEVRYALPEAIKFSPLDEQGSQSSSLRSRIVNYALQFVGKP